MNRFRFKLALLLALVGATPARAQIGGPYSPSVYKEGPGVKLGGTSLTLHPGVALEGGYDSNVFYRPPGEDVGSALLRIRAHLDMSTLSPQMLEGDTTTADPKVDFRFSTQIEYREYLSSDPELQAQRSINLNVGADLGILPKGPFTLRISDLFVRTVDPPSEKPIAGSPTAVQNYTRDFNRTGLLASYRIGTLEIGGGDYFQFNFWETKSLAYGNALNDEGQLFARLRILSQTLLQLTARIGWVHYDNDPAIDSIPFRVLAGASTLFTSWLGFSAELGYGNSFARMGPSFNSVIAKAEVRFLLPKGARIVAAYDRDFHDTLFANYYLDDHIYLVFEQPIVYRLSAHLDGGVRLRHYDGLVDPSILGSIPMGTTVTYSSNTRDEKIYELRAELAVKATSWLQIAASYTLLIDDTDFAIVTMSGGTTSTSPVKYNKHCAFLRVDIAY